MEFVDDNEEEFLPHGVEYVTRGMQAIVGEKQKILKHYLEVPQGCHRVVDV